MACTSFPGGEVRVLVRTSAIDGTGLYLDERRPVITQVLLS